MTKNITDANSLSSLLMKYVKHISRFARSNKNVAIFACTKNNCFRN